jgi:hypothetical protein
MKKAVLGILTIVTIFVAFGYINQNAHGSTSAAPAGRTGSPGDGGPSQSCARAGCHTGGSNPVSGSANASITSTIPATGYIPGQTYTITGFVQATGLLKFGFQISPQNTAGTQRGTNVITDATNTQLVGGNKYVTHRTAGTAGNGSRTWSFNWVAPAAGTGEFSFYGAFNATNSGSNSSGDIVYLEELPVVEAAQIATQPTNVSVCSGANASFSVTATGTNITYQWKKNGVTLTNGGQYSGVTTANLTISNTTGTDADTYTCEVTGSGNTVVSNAATLSIAVAPSITADPLSISSCVGQTATFSVTANGTTPTYQWKRNNTNVTNGGGISGATTNQLTITNVAAGNAGTYTCQVSNTCATPTSAGALLTVNENTAISTQPVTQTLCTGANLTLTVGANGTNLNYQWKRGTTNVGTNSPTLTINNITAGDAGNYTCEITGACGNATSNIAVVTVNTVTAINNQPAPNTTLCQGGNINLSTTAVGTNLSYQWKRGNTNVGTNSSTLSIPNAQPADAGTYTVTTTGACGTVTSSNAIVTINPTTAITTAPVAQNGCVGSNITFTVAATGTNLSYQWKKGVTPVGTDAPTLTLNNVSLTDAANYTVEITGGCGPTVTSNAVSLSVVNSASISQQPVAQQICLGGPLTLSVIGNGGNNTTYQWRRNGNNVGTSSATYTVPVATANDLGTYDVIINGSCGTITSITVNVTALTTTSVNNTITNNTLCGGEDLTLTALATGSNLSYQWALNGEPLSGETAASIALTNVDTSNIGIYSITVSGDCGTLTDVAIADLTITQPPVITGISLPLPVCPGSSIDYTLQTTGDDLQFQWIKNGVPIPNATNPSYNEDAPVNGDVISCSIWNDCDSINTSFGATVIFPAPFVTVSQTGPNEITASSGFIAYQWLDANMQVINGANSQSYNPDFGSGFFYVVATDANGCVDTSAVFNYIPESIDENLSSLITAYPNPTSGDVYFNTPAYMGSFNVKIISSTGQLVIDRLVENNQLNIAPIPSGLYTVLINHKGKIARVRLAKE